MCGRLHAEWTWAELRQIFVYVGPDGHEVEEPPSNFAPNSDIRPTTQQWMIRAGEHGPELARARWGLVPWFHKKPLKEFKLTTINAMAETAAEKSSFKGPLKSKRCLIPASGWWEWTAPETPKGPKTRWSFTPHSGSIITLAGIWERANTADGPIESFAILTQPSEGHLTDYHHRAPVLIKPEDRENWLDHQRWSAVRSPDPMPPRGHSGSQGRSERRQRKRGLSVTRFR